MLPEKLRRKFRQVSPPDHPRMHAGSFYVGVLHSLGFQPFSKLPIRADQSVFRTAGNPEQADLLVGFRVKPRKGLVEFLWNPPRTESSDPGKLVEILQTG